MLFFINTIYYFTLINIYLFIFLVNIYLLLFLFTRILILKKKLYKNASIINYLRGA